MEVFFEELKNYLSIYQGIKVLWTLHYHGDFNIDVTNRVIEWDKLDEFCNLFNEFYYFSHVLYKNA